VKCEICLWVLHESTYHLLSFHMAIEAIENYFRRRGKKISIFSKYKKYRQLLDYTSTKELRKLSRRRGKLKKDLEQGKKIMRKRLAKISI